MSLAIIALGFTSMMFGLVISALVKTAEKTMPLLVMFAIVQVVFTGVLFQLYGTAGRRAVRLADAVALGGRRGGRHADLEHAAAVGPGRPATRCGSTDRQSGSWT